MTSRNRTQRCVDCGTPVGIWALHCSACIGRIRAEKNAARRAAKVTPENRCVDCGVVITQNKQRCRPCASKRHADLQRERRWASKLRRAWYREREYIQFAISQPGD